MRMVDSEQRLSAGAHTKKRCSQIFRSGEEAFSRIFGAICERIVIGKEIASAAEQAAAFIRQTPLSMRFHSFRRIFSQSISQGRLHAFGRYFRQPISFSTQDRFGAITTS